MSEIERLLQEYVDFSLDEMPVTALLGPRQCGKTTLVHMKQNSSSTIFLDMENPADLRTMDNAADFFKLHRNRIICIDEIQRVPELFPIIRYEVDQCRTNGRFIVLGSASPQLLRQSSESLAGRVRYLELTPFILEEIKGLKNEVYTLWLRGGFPRSFLASTEDSSFRWRTDFVRTFLEQDIPQLGFRVGSTQMYRFWTMLAHVNGSILNRSKFGESLGVSHHTINHHLDILSDTYMMRVLQPYEANIKKRLVKSPKVLFRDSGLLHNLLGIRTMQQLMSHPEFGSSWESFAIEQILTDPVIRDRWRPFFYRSHQGEEIDLILDDGIKQIAIECKASSAPEVPKGFYTAITDLGITEAWIVAPVEYERPASHTVKIGSINDVVRRIKTIE